MLREIRLNESSEKTRVFLHMAIRKQTAQGLCFMNEQQPNSKEHKDCSEWQSRKTRLLWLMLPSTQRISKNISASSLSSTPRVADVNSEASFTATTANLRDELAAMDLSTIALALTPSWLVWTLKVMPVWLYFSLFLFCLRTRNYMYQTTVSCV